MRLTLKAKLAATFAVVVALSGVSMFVAIQNLGALNEAIDGIVNGNVAAHQIADRHQRPLPAHRPRREELILADTDARSSSSSATGSRPRKRRIDEQVGKLHDMSSETGKPLVEAFTTAWDGFMEQAPKVEQLAALNSNVEGDGEGRRGGELPEQAFAAYRGIVGNLRTEAVTAADASKLPCLRAQLKDLRDGTCSKPRADIRNVVLAMSDPEAAEAATSARSMPSWPS